MKIADIDYWIKDVKLGQMRGELMLYLFDLMDGKYQEEKWVYYYDPRENVTLDEPISFHHEISFSAEFFDDICMFEYLKKKSVPYEKIGSILKTRKEAEELLKITKPLDDITQSCYTNDEFLNSEYLDDMRNISLEAFLVFMENEKENKEFCKFIAEIIKEKRCPEIKLEGRDPYDIIMEYTDKCRKYNAQK